MREEEVWIEKVLSMSGNLQLVPFQGAIVLLISASSMRRLVFSQVHISGEECVFLCLSCFYKIHQTGRLVYHRSVFLMVLEAARQRSGCQHGRVLVKSCFLVTDSHLLGVSSGGREQREGKPALSCLFSGHASIHQGSPMAP